MHTEEQRLRAEEAEARAKAAEAEVERLRKLLASQGFTKACFLDGNTLFMYNTMDYVWALSAYAVKAKLKAIARLVNKT